MPEQVQHKSGQEEPLHNYSFRQICKIIEASFESFKQQSNNTYLKPSFFLGGKNTPIQKWISAPRRIKGHFRSLVLGTVKDSTGHLYSSTFSLPSGGAVRAHSSDPQVRAGTSGPQLGERSASGGRAGGRAPRGRPGGRIPGTRSRPGPAGGLQAGTGEGGLPVRAGRPAEAGPAEGEGGWEAEAAVGEHHPGLGAQQPTSVCSGFWTQVDAANVAHLTLIISLGMQLT